MDPVSPHQMFMRFIFIPIILLVVLVLVDLYSWQAFNTALGKKRWVKQLFWGSSIILFVFILLAITMRLMMVNVPPAIGYWIFTLSLLSILPKLAVSVVLLLEDITRLFRWVVSFFSPTKTTGDQQSTRGISRKKFISQAALVLGSIPFFHLFHGIVIGRYNFKVHRHKIPIANLPASFEGLTITQISDLHTGTFDNKEAVQCGIDLVNKQGSDLIFFTGDLINYHIDEVEGYESIFSGLSAPMGVFSVLGNHDYGDYSTELYFPSAEAKRLHFERVCKAHAQFGWNLLKNENRMLKRGEDTLAIIGVENWGKGWAQYGDLSKAVIGTEAAHVKLLLSHDPSHWDAQVRPDQPDIAATFSGHTHGMQFGVEIPALDIKWSPVKYVYKQWAGLYRKGSQYLHVSRGFGHIGFLGRAGIMPEVTVFELVRG